MTSTGSQQLRVGLFGAGVVGSGVVEIVQKYTANGRFAALGIDVQIVKIFVRDVSKPRDFVMPPGATMLAGDIDAVLQDESINCVIEVMGGVDTARDVVCGAIRAHKHVITANKALLAAHLAEIEALLAAHPSVSFRFEAAVCGGVPLIQTLQQSFVADRVEGFRGILNGTTNFILSTMAARPAAAYGDVLGEAQRLGFAEADPSADVDGHDVHAKLVLCVRLALGYRFAADERPPRYGIAQVTQADLAYGRDRLRATVKLLGACARLPAHCSGDADADVFTAHVAPAFVPLDSAWARVEGPGNAVQLRSAHLADGLWLGGPGAGRLPTANAVL
eukprot:gene18883-13617_t